MLYLSWKIPNETNPVQKDAHPKRHLCIYDPHPDSPPHKNKKTNKTLLQEINKTAITVKTRMTLILKMYSYYNQ